MSILLYSGQGMTVRPDASLQVQNYHKKRTYQRERRATGVVLCSAAEGDGPWIILKTLYYLFKSHEANAALAVAVRRLNPAMICRQLRRRVQLVAFLPFPVLVSLQSWLISSGWMSAQYFPMVINPLSSCERACDFCGRYCSYS